MAVRITIECGHLAMLRVHKTPEGYTHDWEVFVRGADHADIHYYIEKVVFHLHETFPKPKRTLKEPPYIVKESGYAGFVIPIDIYLKNKDDPKKLQILYDLQLQPSGPAINNVIKHTEIINNPSDEFRRKLLKGGAVAIPSSEGGQDKGEVKSSNMMSKPKLSGGDSKKHRFTEPKTSNSFADLFGDPIKTAKISPDNKKIIQPDKNSVVKSSAATDKGDKTDKNVKVKDSPQKDKRDKIDEKKDKKNKDQIKERNRSKDKSKRSSSPGSKSHTSPSNKRPTSPVPVKKPGSPVPPIKRSASPKPKEKDVKRPCLDKEKDKEKEKIKDATKNSVEASKSEKKKDKKHKEDRDKERKDKYKERERTSSKDAPKVPEKKNEKIEKPEKSEKDKSQESKSSKDGRKSPKPPKESEKSKDEKPKLEKQEKLEKTEKTKDGKSDKDKQKHKHKKRDKKDKRDSSREREKREKREKSKSGSEKQSGANNVSQANPLSTLLAEIPERDSSDSAPSVDEDSFLEPKPVVKKELDDVSVPSMDPPKPLSPTIPASDIKKEKSERSSKKDKPKGSRSEERESRKRKRRSESKCDDDRIIKKEKGRDLSTSPVLEPVSSSQSPVAVDGETALSSKDKEDRNTEQTVKREPVEQIPDSTNSTVVETNINEPPVFSEDYVSQLRDLQHKIMTLQDNQELQRVVQVIAETGQYEITKKTFDFDLCALDRRTVQRLQQFFTAS